MATQVESVAREFQSQSTGHDPATVTAVLNGDTLVVTLHGALSPAEVIVARTPLGAAKIQEFHRQLFEACSATLRGDIERIIGVSIRESTSEAMMGLAAHAFSSGTIVQVFLLAKSVTPEIWNAAGPQVLPA